MHKLDSYLAHAHVSYETLTHSTAYTAEDIVKSVHISGMDFAKTLILKVDGELKMLVLPATYRANEKTLAEALGAERVELASEDEFAQLFGDCDLGAMPPFGNLFGMDVIIARELTLREHLCFNAGNFHEVRQMKYVDFHRLVSPIVIHTGYIRENPSRPVHVAHGHFSH